MGDPGAGVPGSPVLCHHQCDHCDSRHTGTAPGGSRLTNKFNQSPPLVINTSAAQLDQLQLQPKHIVIHLPLCEEGDPWGGTLLRQGNTQTPNLIPRKYKNVRKIGVNASKVP